MCCQTADKPLLGMVTLCSGCKLTSIQVHAAIQLPVFQAVSPTSPSIPLIHPPDPTCLVYWEENLGCA